jgi:hypothetical protein
VVVCRRFRGLGVDQEIPEQVAALDALATIGGREAAQAVMRMIVGQVVQGPGLKSAPRRLNRWERAFR